MKAEAASAGFYETMGLKYPRIQILTIEELLDGKGIQFPGVNVTLAKAQRVKQEGPGTATLEGMESNPAKKRKS